MSAVVEIARDVSTHLVEIGKGLARVVHEQEQTFLDLGDAVQRIAMQVGGIGDEARDLVRVTSGEAMSHILEALEGEFGRMAELCATGVHGGEQALLARTRELVQNLGVSVREYARIVRTLQMLGIATRIESARLGADGRGFSTLADDVEKLAGKIIEYSSSLLEQGRALDVTIAEAEGRSLEMGAKQDSCSLAVSVGLLDGLDNLKRTMASSRASSLQVEGLLADINKSMQGLVGSLQFHDIVRQQVEHVVEAVDDVLAGLARNAAAESPSGAEELAFAAEVCTLQESQTRAASESLSTAVASLRSEMRTIASSVRQVVLDAGGGSGEGASESTAAKVLDALENEVRAAATSMRELAVQGEDMGRTMEMVASTVSDMTAFLADIEDVGSEIELIALNASISAAHTGDKGKALGVLATSIQRLSQDAGTQTVALADLLRSIDTAAGELKALALSYLDMSRVSAVKEELERLTLALREASGEAERHFRGVASSCDVLARDMERRVQDIAVDRLVCAALDKGAERFAVVAAKARRGVPAGTQVPRERMKHMHQRYTMQQERVLHGRHVGESTDDGMGDNIELF